MPEPVKEATPQLDRMRALAAQIDQREAILNNLSNPYSNPLEVPPDAHLYASQLPKLREDLTREAGVSRDQYTEVRAQLSAAAPAKEVPQVKALPALDTPPGYDTREYDRYVVTSQQGQDSVHSRMEQTTVEINDRIENGEEGVMIDGYRSSEGGEQRTLLYRQSAGYSAEGAALVPGMILMREELIQTAHREEKELNRVLLSTKEADDWAEATAKLNQVRGQMLQYNEHRESLVKLGETFGERIPGFEKRLPEAYDVDAVTDQVAERLAEGIKVAPEEVRQERSERHSMSM